MGSDMSPAVELARGVLDLDNHKDGATIVFCCVSCWYKIKEAEYPFGELVRVLDSLPDNEARAMLILGFMIGFADETLGSDDNGD